MTLTPKHSQTFSKGSSPQKKETTNHETKPALKSILKNDSKSPFNAPKLEEAPSKLPLRQKKPRVIFKNDDKHELRESVKTIASYELGNRTPFRDLRNRRAEKVAGKMLPEISPSNVYHKMVEDNVFKNWVSSQNFPEIQKNALSEMLNSSGSNSTNKEAEPSTFKIVRPVVEKNATEAIEKLGSSCNVKNCRDREVKRFVEKAITDGKIYVCNGPYPCFRASLNRRGWIEQIDPKKNSNPNVLLARVVNSNNSSIGQIDKLPSFYHNIDAGMVEKATNLLQNEIPRLYFTVKTTEIINLHLKSNQIANHFGKASSFTTKVGLTQNLKCLPFFADRRMETFYPRCYCLLLAEEKQAFIDDYHFTSCVGFLKHYMHQYLNNMIGKKTKPSTETPQQQQNQQQQPQAQQQKTQEKKTPNELQAIDVSVLREKLQGSRNITVQQNAEDHTVLQFTINLEPCIDASIHDTMVLLDKQLQDMKSGNSTASVPGGETQMAEFGLLSKGQTQSFETPDEEEGSSNNNNSLPSVTATPSKPCKPLMKHISVKALKFALKKCQLFLEQESHKDLTEASNENQHGITSLEVMMQREWRSFLEAYKLYVTNQIPLDKASKDMYEECKSTLDLLTKCLPQYHIDGHLNVWIIKPGAKSRGRGIQCSGNFNEILVTALNMKNCVVQKYIERPLLIYKAKFDLRQWFLITDWNPLTLWFYKDCYLRFCSEDFTLDNFHESIHLSNNSVQKKYQISKSRSANLPDDNMWTSEEFKVYLKKEHAGNVWEDVIQPQMRECIINVLLCTQDIVENRKGSFELFGADFMLTEDLRAWLIEINSSPSMSRTTNATFLLVEKVLEDTVKVVVDRLENPSADTGGFEIVYQQPMIPKHPSFHKENVIRTDKIKAIYKATTNP